MKTKPIFRAGWHTVLVAVACLLVNGTGLHAQTVEARIGRLLQQMTLEEKIKQLHHEGSFNTADNTRLHIPGFFMADGPHGVRDGLATCFPVGIAMAATWDPELAQKIGVAMGKEFRGKGKHQALGPCIDLTRDPRNGRSPESGGEDPYLCAQINAALVQGMQSTGCIATVKHFNCKNRQENRDHLNVIITQRWLMEHYGLNFRTAIQQGGAMSVMSAYNLINGYKCAQNHNLLTTILREKWGFPYYVVSDWGAIWGSEAAIEASTDVCMGSDNYQRDLLNLVHVGAVSEATIDAAVRNVLRTKIIAGMLDYYPPGDPSDVNSPAHQRLALEAARKSIVLLKNENNLLPLDKDKIKKIAVIGPSAAVAQLDGTGSSYVTPYYSVSPLAGLESKIGAGKILYAKGCDINSTNITGFADAITFAREADAVIFFGGLDASQEGEGLDRVGGSIDLPGKQQDLINYLAYVNPNLIAVIESGGICGLDRCLDNVKALVYAFYPGQEGGNALADVLFGDYNPGGKLPVTMPKTDAQLPERNQDFNDDFGCGYRWFDQKGLTPAFAFGHGLSYTTFAYSNLVITPAVTPAGQIVTVNFDVTNTGARSGEEVAQLYLTDVAARVPMPIKQLKGFKRISLEPGETQTATLTLSSEEFYFFNEVTDQFEVEPGTFVVRVGGSSDNLSLSGNIQIMPAPLRPDLVITNVKMVPPYPIKGDSVVFLTTVKNEGISASPANVTHRVDFRLNGKTVSWSADFNQSIPAGGMALVCANAGPAGFNKWVADEIGTFSVEAVVDVQNAIAECIEDNNQSTASFTVIARPPQNLALNKSVVVSSVESSGLEGFNAVDGNHGTRWSSQFSDPQFITVDLGAVHQLERVVLNWENAFGKEYKILVSENGADWQTVKHEINGDGGLDQITFSAQGRYVQMYGIRRGTPWGYSLYEFEIYSALASEVSQQETNAPPQGYLLLDNFPNPLRTSAFNPTTTIRYAVPRDSQVRIQVFTVSGQLLATLVNARHAPGQYHVEWNGADANGHEAASGIYLYRLETREFVQTKKMVLLR